MKKIIFICFLIFITTLCFSENNFESGLFCDWDRITWQFNKGKLKELVYDEEQEKTIKNFYNYEIDKKGPYDELIIIKDDKEERFVTLLPDNGNFLLVYENDSNKAIHNGFFSKNSFLYKRCKYITSSNLIEGNDEYVSDNLGSTELYKPWVEGKPDSGIGETINISSKEIISSLVISNGFVSRKKSTFYNNNRVKELKISNVLNNDEYQIVVLQDSANPTEINLSFSSTNIELEILSVYKGEKYDDTCINFILCK